MSEIINFIKGNGKLVSPPILLEFKRTILNTNNEILPKDAYEFVKLFTHDVTLIEDDNFVIRQRNILHSTRDFTGTITTFYLYNNPSGTIEKWSPPTWQKTTNNSTLYSAILAIIRPNCSFEQTKELIRKIIDKQDSEGARLLGEISLHFFARGQSYFRYPSTTTFTPK